NTTTTPHARGRVFEPSGSNRQKPTCRAGDPIMPRPGMLWRHVIVSTLNSWLPGDPRGFRNKKHRIHSSGDYKNPPPPTEHAGLRRYAKLISEEPVIIPAEFRPTVGKVIVTKLLDMDYPVLVISVAGMHAHFLAELPEKRHLV